MPYVISRRTSGVKPSKPPKGKGKRRKVSVDGVISLVGTVATEVISGVTSVMRSIPRGLHRALTRGLK